MKAHTHKIEPVLEADVVIAKMSTLPFPLDAEISADHRRAFDAIVQALGEGV